MLGLCVFCGSSPGADPGYGRAAVATGKEIARRGLTLVYGGAKVGLMGLVADAALDAGGEVIGVLPEALSRKEIAHTGLTRLEVVGSMHERKARMAELSDGFWPWGQLGLHGKPVGFLNIAGYYDGLPRFLDHTVDQAFVKPVHRQMLTFADHPETLIDALAAYAPPVAEKWLERFEL